MDRGEYEKAGRAYVRAINLQPRHGDLYLGLGLAMMALERYQHAAVAFDYAVHVNPKLGRAWAGRGDALKELGRGREAEEAYEEASKLGRAGEPGDRSWRHPDGG
jgi:tetratricopeptide (TPR) repeat protein